MSGNLNSPIEEHTPIPTPGPSTQIPRSVAGTPYWASHHLSDSSSYFPPSSPRQRPVSPVQNRRTMSGRFPQTLPSTSVNIQRRQPHRSASVASSSFNSRGGHVNDAGGMFSEAEEDDGQGAYLSDDDTPGAPRRGRGMSIGPQSVHEAVAAGEDTTPNGGSIDHEFNEDDPLTVKDRQSLINVQHPFGLPIWKPALYKKSRTVTRNAETELHAQPSRFIDLSYLPGNILWALLFGWWMSIIFVIPAAVLFLVPAGGRQYARLVYGLAWYIFWPFGKYVQGDGPEEEKDEEDRSTVSDLEGGGPRGGVSQLSSTNSQASGGTIRGPTSPITPVPEHQTELLNTIAPSPSWDSVAEAPIQSETVSLLRNGENLHLKSYGSLPPSLGPAFDPVADAKRHWLGRTFFWLFLFSIILPIMALTCLICWALVITIPMAKLQWALIEHLFWRHTTIQFCSAPQEIVVPATPADINPFSDPSEGNGMTAPSSFTVKTLPRLQAGQSAPSGSPRSTVLLCTYRAIGLKYYKYTVGGVNIMFVNLMPLVFFVILDGFFLLPYVDKLEEEHQYIPPILNFFASRALIFVLSMASVIPLSYFIGMAVASISAQSSIGMGAVINATFGSIIEIITYAIALTQGKGLLVEGSIVGSLLAGVGLMPGLSMISGAMMKKEQKFNAKSAGVTSTMLIMAIIGTLTPTLFYQTYGNFELVCDGCPSVPGIPLATLTGEPWKCGQCYYQHPDPVNDPFYQGIVKHLMNYCAGILVFSYLIGLWFSLRTHASQIWQNPQQLMNPMDLSHIAGGGTGRTSIYDRVVASQLAQSIPQQTNKLLRKASFLTNNSIKGGHEDAGAYHASASRSGSGDNMTTGPSPNAGSSALHPGGSPAPVHRRVSIAPAGLAASHSPSRPQHSGYGPILDTVSHSAKDPNYPNLPLPSNLTTDDFTHAVAVTVSALRRGEVGVIPHGSEAAHDGHGGGEHGGHEAPSWSRLTSATVLLGCTALYAALAEILIDVVDDVLQGSGIDEKFVGVTLFALIPNVTEFMNAISFALNGNIALSMEIGSAYALQVCLLQIPAMVAFSAWYDPRHIGSIASTFTMIFPRWDVIAIILSIFLLTYTYIEAKSNYHRGSILVLSYVVLMAGFYYAPAKLESETQIRWATGGSLGAASNDVPTFSFLQAVHTAFLSLFTK